MNRARTRRRLNPAIKFFFFILLLAVLGIMFFIAQRTYRMAAYPIKYQEQVLLFSEQNDLPPSLVYAVIRTESSFRPEAESHVGARGLMQLTNDTFDWLKYMGKGREEDVFDDLYDSNTNIEYGTALLRLLMNEFDTVENSLCAYHAGPTRARQWLENEEYAPDGKNIVNIPYTDTSYYVNRVIETQEIYQELYDIV